MKYIKLELEEIELLDPTLFVSCSGEKKNQKKIMKFGIISYI